MKVALLLSALAGAFFGTAANTVTTPCEKDGCKARKFVVTIGPAGCNAGTFFDGTGTTDGACKCDEQDECKEDTNQSDPMVCSINGNVRIVNPTPGTCLCLAGIGLNPGAGGLQVTVPIAINPHGCSGGIAVFGYSHFPGLCPPPPPPPPVLPPPCPPAGLAPFCQTALVFVCNSCALPCEEPSDG
ncbi:MAG: hypothetical protein KDE27_02870 [Planctomycetes bacterium]|nr:hypothetical protein [Planctomycetota bacterium]